MIALLPRTSVDGSATFGVETLQLEVRTERRLQIVDVTETLAAAVFRSRVVHGLATVQTTHTTTAVVVNENEPLLLTDVQRTLERLVPEGAGYSHDVLEARLPPVPPDERKNGAAHCRAFLMPTTATLAVRDGLLELGRWQRVFLVELDGPQLRRLAVTVLGLQHGPRR